MRETIPVVVRAAVPADARAIATVHVETWRVAYAHIFDPNFFDQDRLTVERREEVWRSELTPGSPGGASTWPKRATRSSPSVPSGRPGTTTSLASGEVYAIYVAPAHMSRGAGRALMERARRTFSGHGFSAAVLWVLEENAQARAFYQRSGWAPDGATKTYEAGTVALRYRIALSGGPRERDEDHEAGHLGAGP